MIGNRVNLQCGARVKRAETCVGPNPEMAQNLESGHFFRRQSFLQAPPFGWLRPAIAVRGGSGVVDGRRIQILLEKITLARVGGEFWQPPAWRHKPASKRIVLRPGGTFQGLRMLAEVMAHHSAAEIDICLPDALWAKSLQQTCLQLGVGILPRAVDPWSLAEAGRELHVCGSDPLAFIGMLLGCSVHCHTRGRFAGWGLSQDDVSVSARPDLGLLPLANAALFSHIGYRNPFTGKIASCEEIIDILTDWRRSCNANRDIAGYAGVNWWKRSSIQALLHTGGRAPRRVVGVASAERALIANDERIAVWPSRAPQALLRSTVPMAQIEDGFLRSSGLGSNLTPPCSIVVDRRGAHYDPSRPSDLEVILAETVFEESLLARARRLIRTLVASELSKYNTGEHHLDLSNRDGRRIVLVAGQVEDDVALRLAGAGLTSNLQLLCRVRALEPNSFIIYKPHPDVLAGHRRGLVAVRDANAYADLIVRDVAMPTLLKLVDAVHVISSLTGYEALLRQCEVVVHGQPFYAGWGLTKDLNPVSRRTRVLSLEQLVAGSLILYPRYMDPVTGLPCPVEILTERLAAGRKRHDPINAVAQQARRLQGLLSAKIGFRQTRVPQ